MTPISVLLVDDEPLAREGLRLLLAQDPEIGLIREARNGGEAVAAMRAQLPDLVFLDVQMPELDGLGVVAAMGAATMPATVFVTAHDQYAIAAFEIAALDYLLKPVTAARFAQALERAKLRLRASSTEAAARHARGLLDAIAAFEPRHATAASGRGPAAPALAAPASTGAWAGPQRIAVRSADRTIFVPVETIERAHGAENYVELHADGEVHLLQVTMSALERALDPSRFLRVHRSILLQVARIAELRPIAHGEYQITMASGAQLRSGRTYHDRVKQLLRNPF
jgi:two-component system, LytTR family, response regulator